jgi:hypothetical protein
MSRISTVIPPSMLAAPLQRVWPPPRTANKASLSLHAVTVLTNRLTAEAVVGHKDAGRCHVALFAAIVRCLGRSVYSVLQEDDTPGEGRIDDLADMSADVTTAGTTATRAHQRKPGILRRCTGESLALIIVVWKTETRPDSARQARQNRACGCPTLVGIVSSQRLIPLRYVSPPNPYSRSHSQPGLGLGSGSCCG